MLYKARLQWPGPSRRKVSSCSSLQLPARGEMGCSCAYLPGAYSCAYLRVSVLTCVFLCLPACFCAYLLGPCSCAYLRVLVLTCVFLCLPSCSCAYLPGACSCAYLPGACSYAYLRVLVLACVFLCLPACSCAYLRVLVLTFRERVLVLTFWERVLMLTCVFLCLPACSCAYLRVLVLTFWERVLVLTCVFLCLPSGSVFLCLPFGSVFLGLPSGSMFLCLPACSCAYLPGAHNLVKEYYGIRYQGGSLSFIHCLTCVIFLFTLRYFPKFLNYNFPKLLCVIFLFTQCCVHTQHCELTKVAQNATATLRYATLQGSVACRKYATMPQAIHYPLLQQPHVHMSQDRSFALQSLTKYGMLHITKCIIYTELHSF